MGKNLIFGHHQNTLSETYIGLFLSIIIMVLDMIFLNGIFEFCMPENTLVLVFIYVSLSSEV